MAKIRFWKVVMGTWPFHPQWRFLFSCHNFCYLFWLIVQATLLFFKRKITRFSHNPHNNNFLNRLRMQRVWNSGPVFQITILLIANANKNTNVFLLFVLFLFIPVFVPGKQNCIWNRSYKLWANVILFGNQKGEG